MRLSYKRHCGSVLDAFVHLDYSLWGKPTFMSQAALGEICMERNWGSAYEELGLLPTVMWTSHLGTDPSTHSGLEMISAPAEILTTTTGETFMIARTTLLSCSWIPDLQKLCEIINVRCFKLLDLGVIWYTAVDN